MTPEKRALLEEKLEGREYKDAEAQSLMENIIKETLDALQVFFGDFFFLIFTLVRIWKWVHDSNILSTSNMARTEVKVRFLFFILKIVLMV